MVNINIIVPFRDLGDGERVNQLKAFYRHFRKFLKGHSYHIYVIEQDCAKKQMFNRGQLLNYGFTLVPRSQRDSIFIFHDVDLLPSDELKKYYITLPRDNECIHIASCWDRYSNNKNYFGGVTSFSYGGFSKLNGFPNNFWGWGGEDDELFKRAKDCKLKIIKTRGSFVDLEDKTLKEKLSYLKENNLKCMTKWELLDCHSQSWRENGLSEISKRNIRAFQEVAKHLSLFTITLTSR